MKVMIVDDSRIMRDNIKKIAQKINGLDIVGEASNGIEAIKVFKATRPHIVTIDLTMPKLNGIDTIKQLMRDDPKLRILVISSLNDIETALEAISFGAKGFLHKPFNEEELLVKLREII